MLYRISRVSIEQIVKMAALLYAAKRLARTGAPGAAVILVVAVVVRVLLLPLPPTLSEDALRDLWDGKVAGAGLNPYLLEPDAPELEPLRSSSA